jgi:hypothetical protein
LSGDEPVLFSPEEANGSNEVAAPIPRDEAKFIPGLLPRLFTRGVRISTISAGIEDNQQPVP